MPTAGKAPCYGLLSTGRSRHAIPGAALPFAVILTAHRLHSPPPPGPADGADLGEPFIMQRFVCMARVGALSLRSPVMTRLYGAIRYAIAPYGLFRSLKT